MEFWDWCPTERSPEWRHDPERWTSTYRVMQLVTRPWYYARMDFTEAVALSPELYNPWSVVPAGWWGANSTLERGDLF